MDSTEIQKVLANAEKSKRPVIGKNKDGSTFKGYPHSPTGLGDWIISPDLRSSENSVNVNIYKIETVT